jgi:hypothetical protein
MPTYNGWTIVTLPSLPPAPQVLGVDVISIVSVNTSPFTGQQQIYNWQSQYLQFHVDMPPMNFATAQNWVTFLKSLYGQACVFEFSSTLTAAYPLDFPSGAYWRLVSNSVKYTINQNHLYSVSFDVRQAI